MAMQITINPTNKYATYRGVEMRIWSGTDEKGEPLTALVHALVRPGGWHEPPDGMVLVRDGSVPDLNALEKVTYRTALCPVLERA